MLAVTLGCALGGVARFWVSEFVARRLVERLPWGTLVVNVTGAGLIGLAAALALGIAGSITARPSAWALLVIGILGSYTTVSSFSFHGVDQQPRWRETELRRLGRVSCRLR